MLNIEFQNKFYMPNICKILIKHEKILALTSTIFKICDFYYIKQNYT